MPKKRSRVIESSSEEGEHGGGSSGDAGVAAADSDSSVEIVLRNTKRFRSKSSSQSSSTSSSPSVNKKASRRSGKRSKRNKDDDGDSDSDSDGIFGSVGSSGDGGGGAAAAAAAASPRRTGRVKQVSTAKLSLLEQMKQRRSAGAATNSGAGAATRSTAWSPSKASAGKHRNRFWKTKLFSISFSNLPTPSPFSHFSGYSDESDRGGLDPDDGGGEDDLGAYTDDGLDDEEDAEEWQAQSSCFPRRDIIFCSPLFPATMAHITTFVSPKLTFNSLFFSSLPPFARAGSCLTMSATCGKTILAASVAQTKQGRTLPRKK